MKKLIICAIMILMFISCDLVNTGIPDFIATHGSGSTSAVDPVIVTDLSTNEVTYTQNDTANSETPTNLAVTTKTYTPLTTALGTLYYYCIVTNTIKDGGVKKATSKFAKITVNDKVNAKAPVIETDLSTEEVTYTLNDAATPLTIVVKDSKTLTLTYKWHSNDEANTNNSTEAVGINDKATYTPLTTARGTLYYYCEVTNTIDDNKDGGVKTATTTSKFAKITVNEAVGFISATQKGGSSGSVTTTDISIEFNKAITGLKADHITLTGATKGDLSGSGSTYTIAIRDITVENGETVPTVPTVPNVTVAITGVPGYTINPASRSVKVYVGTVATPEISPDGGSFVVSREITITSTTAGAKIYYTTDGIEPTTKSTLYKMEFRIGEATALVGGEVVVKAIAVKAGMLNSIVATKTFTKIESVLATVLVGSADQSFDVGAPAGTDTDPTVKFTKDFYMGVSEVTQGQYYDVMTNLTGENGKVGSRRPSEFGKDDSSDTWRKLPVENVTWYDAIAFCNALSVAEGLGSCYTGSGASTVLDLTKNGYRLPTEAELEYAAGGGTDNRTTYAGTSDEGELGNYAWYDANASSITHEVKTRDANALGSVFRLQGYSI